MSRLTRRATAVAALLVVSVMTAGPALADDPTPTPSPSTSAGPTGFACLDEKAGYEVSGVCQLIVLKAETVCRGDVPWLDYSLEPEGTPNVTTTLVWGDENGKHYTMADLPLTGSVMWPGAEVDADGHATDWPGWSLVDGVWVEHDEWDWVRPQVQLTFHVNPTATITAYYPEAAAPCAGPPTTEVLAEGDAEGSAVLAMTGSDVLHLGMAAAALVALGGVLLLVRRRGHRAAQR